MSDAALLGVDWGSTSVRAMRLGADGAILDTRRRDDGVLQGGGDYEGRLRALLGDWIDATGSETPVLMCGMIGSDRGWMRAPYARAPAGADDLARALVRPSADINAWIVPGISWTSGETAEVMRGEETLIVGVCAGRGHETAQICLPGTHSKWVDVVDGRIERFHTYMTGEVRALVLAHGALASAGAQVASSDAFAAGLREGAGDGGATRALFQARARRLLDQLAPEHAASFVSGVLIGAELAGQGIGIPREANALAPSPLLLVADGALARDYGVALVAAGADHETIGPDALAARGLLELAHRAGLIGPEHD